MLPPALVEKTCDVLTTWVFSRDFSIGMREISRQRRFSEEAVKRGELSLPPCILGLRRTASSSPRLVLNSERPHSSEMGVRPGQQRGRALVEEGLCWAGRASLALFEKKCRPKGSSNPIYLLWVTAFLLPSSSHRRGMREEMTEP